MNAFEQFQQLHAILTDTSEGIAKMRNLIGEQRLQMIYAKSLMAQFGEVLSPTTVAEATGMSRSGAEKAISKSGQISVK